MGIGQFARVTGLVVGLLAVLVSAGVARGQSSLGELLEPRLTRIQLDQLVRASSLAHDQRLIVSMLYEDYADGLDQLVLQTDAEADQVGRQEVQAAYAGRLHLPQHELNEKRRAMLIIFARALPEADAMLEDLLLSFEAILTPEQRGPFIASVRDIKRTLVFEPLRREEQSYDYAGDGIDLAELVDEAMSPGGELFGMDTGAIGATLNWYEAQLDVLLVRLFGAYRDASLQQRIAQIDRGGPGVQEAEAALVANWKVLFDINRAGMEAIAQAAAAELGPEAAEQWRWRFQQEIFPWLYRARRADRFIGWLDRDANVSQEVDEKIRDLYWTYADKRDQLVDEAASLMLQAREEHGVIIHSMSDATAATTPAERAIYQDLLRNSGELSKLEADIVANVEALLDESQRRSLERYLRTSR